MIKFLTHVSKKHVTIYNELLVTVAGSKLDKTKIIFQAIKEFIDRQKNDEPIIINKIHWEKCFDNLEKIKDFQSLQQEINNLQLYKDKVERDRFK